MRFLLDTNVLSEVRKQKPHGGVLAWFTSVHLTASMFIPSIALFELQMGVEQLRPKDPLRAASFEFWVSRLGAAANVLPLDAEAGREAARLLAGKPMHLVADAMIAAIAKVNALTIATRNTRDFEQFAVPLVDPFKYTV